MDKFQGFKKFEFNNVGQCWYCKRRIGAMLKEVEGYWWWLPECEVSNLYMTEVYEPHCPKFEKVT